MTEPNTVNIALVVPNTGDLVGAWGTAAINPNLQALDGLAAGKATISLSSATTIALSVATGTLTPGAGPNQSQNAVIKLTGTLTGNCVLQMGMPGRIIFDNRCTVGTSYVQVAPSAGTGNAVGLPPGEKVMLFYDGTDVDYVDFGRVGSAFDLHGATAIPAWIVACTVRPYLLKDGSVYSTSVYPALGAALGSTFGGNGVSTFGVPDELARARIGYDPSGTRRLTAGGSGVSGTTMGSAGGNEFMQQHNHTASATLVWASNGQPITNAGNIGFLPPSGPGTKVGADNSQSITVTLQVSGQGFSQNVQPSIVSFLPLIKT